MVWHRSLRLSSAIEFLWSVDLIPFVFWVSFNFDLHAVHHHANIWAFRSPAGPSAPSDHRRTVHLSGMIRYLLNEKSNLRDICWLLRKRVVRVRHVLFQFNREPLPNGITFAIHLKWNFHHRFSTLVEIEKASIFTIERLHQCKLYVYCTRTVRFQRACKSMRARNR